MDQNGATPLFAAARGSYDSVVKALVTAGANVNLTVRATVSFLGRSVCHKTVV